MGITTRLALLFFTATSFLSTSPEATAGPVTCSTRISHVTMTAFVTCHLGIDVSTSRHGFNVEYRPFDKRGSGSGTGILVCNFIKRSGTLQCIVQDGYHFNYTVTDRLTVEIPSVTQNHTGVFKCQLVPPDGRSEQPCNLTNEDISLSVDKSLMGSTTGSQLQSDKPVTSTESQKDNETDVYSQPGAEEGSEIDTLALAIGIAVLVIILIVVAAVIAAVKRRSRGQKTGERTKESLVPLTADQTEQERHMGTTSVVHVTLRSGAEEEMKEKLPETEKEKNAVQENEKELPSGMLHSRTAKENEKLTDTSAGGEILRSGTEEEMKEKLPVKTLETYADEKSGEKEQAETDEPGAGGEIEEKRTEIMQPSVDGETGKTPPVETHGPVPGGGTGENVPVEIHKPFTAERKATELPTETSGPSAVKTTNKDHVMGSLQPDAGEKTEEKLSVKMPSLKAAEEPGEKHSSDMSQQSPAQPHPEYYKHDPRSSLEDGQGYDQFRPNLKSRQLKALEKQGQDPVVMFEPQASKTSTQNRRVRSRLAEKSGENMVKTDGKTGIQQHLMKTAVHQLPSKKTEDGHKMEKSSSQATGKVEEKYPSTVTQHFPIKQESGKVQRDTFLHGPRISNPNLDFD